MSSNYYQPSGTRWTASRGFLLEREAMSRFSSGDLQVGPLRMSVAEGKSVDIGYDMVIILEWKERRHRFMVEFKAVATPRMIEDTIARLRRIQPRYPDLLPMVAAPVLTEQIIQRLIEEQVSGIDLSGNYVIIVPGEWFLLRSGQPNKFPANQPIKGIYEGTSALVGRVLLSCPEFDKAKDLQAEIQRRGGAITKGTVSKVLTALEEELIVRRTSTIKLLQPELLLERLTVHYRPPIPTRRVVGKAAVEQQFLGLLTMRAEQRGARVIGRDETLYTTAPRTSDLLTIWVSDIDSLLDGASFEADHRFPNVELLQTTEKTLYFDPLVKDGFPWCSRLQIYLELMQQGARERDTAGSIGRDILQAGGIV